MKRFLFTLLIIALLLFSFVSMAREFQTGEIVRMPERSYFRIMNESPISNIDKTFQKGDSCYVRQEGNLTVLYSSLEGPFRVRYTIGTTQRGCFCPCGTEFLVYGSELQ
jgi:hypothetical protein